MCTHGKETSKSKSGEGWESHWQQIHITEFVMSVPRTSVSELLHGRPGIAKCAFIAFRCDDEPKYWCHREERLFGAMGRTGKEIEGRC